MVFLALFLHSKRRSNHLCALVENALILVYRPVQLGRDPGRSGSRAGVCPVGSSKGIYMRITDFCMYRVFIKNCVFFKFTANHPLHEGDQLICFEIWVYSHSYWLTFFCTTNSSPVLARERSQNIVNSWKKYLKNTLYLQRDVWEKLCFF